MKYSNSILRILASSVFASLFSACGTTETTIENSWTTGSKGVARRSYTGAWEYNSVEKGNDIVIRLFRGDFIVGSYDGQSLSEIAIVLPTSVKAGDTIPLKVIPSSRPYKRVDDILHTAEMRPGEIVAMQFGNPFTGWMKASDRAFVRVISINRHKAIFRVVIKADLDPDFDLDIDKKFSLPISEYTKRENKP